MTGMADLSKRIGARLKPKILSRYLILLAGLLARADDSLWPLPDWKQDSAATRYIDRAELLCTSSTTNSRSGSESIPDRLGLLL